MRKNWLFKSPILLHSYSGLAANSQHPFSTVATSNSKRKRQVFMVKGNFGNITSHVFSFRNLCHNVSTTKPVPRQSDTIQFSKWHSRIAEPVGVWNWKLKISENFPLKLRKEREMLLTLIDSGQRRKNRKNVIDPNFYPYYSVFPVCLIFPIWVTQ